MHLEWRWFTGLGFDQEIPHHSTFSKNRHGRFQESNMFQEIFEVIVASFVEAGVAESKGMSNVCRFVQSNAENIICIDSQEVPELHKVNHNVLEELCGTGEKRP